MREQRIRNWAELLGKVYADEPHKNELKEVKETEGMWREAEALIIARKVSRSKDKTRTVLEGLRLVILQEILDDCGCEPVPEGKRFRFIMDMLDTEFDVYSLVMDC